MKIPETVVFQNLIGALREVQREVRADPRDPGLQIKDIPRQIDSLTGRRSRTLGVGTPGDQDSQEAENEPSKHG
jgi:hypothetical protein